MSERVFVVGVGMIPYTKPGQSPAYFEMGAQATRLALADAGIDYANVHQAFVGYVYGDSASGQRALYGVGMTGIPVVNVNNNCSTGSTALFLARQAVRSGAVDCALALGFEQLRRGAIGPVFTDRPSVVERFDQTCDALLGASDLPLAVFGKPLTTAEVMADAVLIPGAMTRLMACPPTCGGAAALLVSERFAKRYGLRMDVELLAQAMTTDTPGTFESRSMIELVGADMTRSAAQQVFEAAGIGPEDLNVVELHDCFAHNELISYEALGLCATGLGGAAAVTLYGRAA